MKPFQKALFVLTTVIVLGWVGTTTASAQVAFFVSASGARQVRGEGRAEATGVIQFSANSSGTIVTGTVIRLDYGTTVLGTGNNLPCSGTVSFNGGAAGFITKTCSGNVVILTFNAGQAIVATDSIALSGIRVNANALGVGANVNVAVTATVPAAQQATNPVTLVVFTTLTVATVQARPSTSVKVGAGDNEGPNILFCNLRPGVVLGEVRVDMTEKFAEAFLSQTQEEGLGLDGEGDDPDDFEIRFAFEDIPVGVEITATVHGDTDDILEAGLDGDVGDAFLSSTGGQDHDFDIELTDTDTANIETLVMVFELRVPDITLAAFPLVEGVASLEILFRAQSDPPGAPIFSGSSARQFEGDGFRTLACASYLLFPWVAYTGDGAVDTGLAVANTSKDPPVIGTESQKGDVTLYFWRSTGLNHPAPVKIATALEGGRTTTYVLSQLGAPFSGYIIAVCGFQMGHGLAAFLSGGAFNGYIGMSIQNPRIHPDDVTESSGH